MEAIPEAVRSLIERHIISAAHVEVLLLLHRRPGQRFDAPAVGRELRIDSAQAGQMLSRLFLSGLVRRVNGGYAYRPKNRRLTEAVDTLARMYPAYRLAIVSLIFSRPTGAIRDHPGTLPEGS